MPFVAYRDFPSLLGSWSGEVAMWIQISLILLMKTVGTVVGLTSALLLIMNSSPSAGSLGALNGLAQTLGAAGRAVGPVVTGGLFSAFMRAVDMPSTNLARWLEEKCADKS
ncbi:hypothetical protein ACLOAV_009990 [Pseudogymnoascus australis]